MEKMTYPLSESKISQFDESLKKQIGIALVEGGELTNPAWTSQISNEDFFIAIKNSLASHGLLSSGGRYQLKVSITKMDQPVFGLD